MNENNPDKLVIFDLSQAIPQEQRSHGFRDRGGGLKERVSHAHEVAVDELANNMTHFLSGIERTLSQGAAVTGEFQVDTVEVNAQISASGKVGLMGTGIGLEGQAGITFVFKRREPR